MEEDGENLGLQLKEIVKKIQTGENIEELDQFRKVFRKNVSFWMRSYVAAYLFRQILRSGGSSPLVKKKIDPVSLFFGAGRSRRVGPRDVVHTLIQTGLALKEDIGEIKILENYSFVDVEKKIAEDLIKALDNSTFRGRPLKVNFAKKKEAEAE